MCGCGCISCAWPASWPKSARRTYAIRDDGRGGATLAGGTGLLGLQDRVEALGGRIFLDSPPEAGTTLRLDLPLTDGGTFR
jgi:glucose-6-phosphate-specific signal transduction histidine kinase